MNDNNTIEDNMGDIGDKNWKEDGNGDAELSKGIDGLKILLLANSRTKEGGDSDR